MKLSVIIAIIHMTVGVIIKAFNSLYFKKKLDFYFEFIPQFIFLFLLFGYMDFLIVLKWLTDWNGNRNPPPSIISTMMNIGLKMGKTVTFCFILVGNWHNRWSDKHVGWKGQHISRFHSTLYSTNLLNLRSNDANSQTLHRNQKAQAKTTKEKPFNGRRRNGKPDVDLKRPPSPVEPFWAIKIRQASFRRRTWRYLT